MRSFKKDMSLMFSLTDRIKKNQKWDEGDINGWILNQAMAPNPFVRNMMSMMYLSDINGLSKINYPNSEFMKRINFEKLNIKLKKPEIRLFTMPGISTNRSSHYSPIDR